MRKIAVGDVMTRNFVSALPSTSLHECAKIMTKERIDSLLITEGKRLIGILTSRDILRKITESSESLKKISAIKIATRKLAVIKPSADISQALEKMKSLNFRRLPVLSNGLLIGVVTLKDILSVEPNIYAEMHTLMDDIKERENKKANISTQWPLEGLCENCGVFSELLRVEGQLLCPDCREDLH